MLNSEKIWKIQKKIVKQFNLLFFHIFHIFSQFPSVFSKSFHYSTSLSSIISIYMNLGFSIYFISFHYSTCLSSIFFTSVHNFLSYLKDLENTEENCEMIWKIWMKCEMIWKTWKKDKLNSEMIIFSILSISYHYFTCLSSIFSISFHNFLLYFPNLFTIQLIFFHICHIFLLI
jgi:hypothetical protein